ncbi:MAG TPA: hypothetical protein VF274_11405 [Alphaproteobacteria bacterium]|jgi:hypothetical protein
MVKNVSFIMAFRDAHDARLMARLRVLYARALDEPLPEEWRGLAERIEAAADGSEER